jgi:hypothetical protein
MRPQILVLLLAGAGCGNATNNADMAPGPDIAHSPGDLSPENLDLGNPIPAATTAIVTTSDYKSTGTLAAVNLADDKVTRGIDNTLDSSTIVRAINGKVIVLNQYPHGTVRFYDPANGYKNPIEVKVGANANPHDIVAVPATSKYYVTLYGNKADSALGVIDLRPPAGDGGAGTPALVKSIPLTTAMKDPDGIPEANDLYACGGFAYVTLQDLDETNMAFKPTGPSRIAAIDFSKDAVDTTQGIIQLDGANPNGVARDGTGCDLVLVADAAYQFGAVDGSGGIERVDLSARISKGIVLKDTDLKGHPSTIATTPASRTIAYTTLSINSGGGSQVIAFDPQAAKLTSAITPPASFIAFAATTPDGSQLFVGIVTPDKMTNMPAVGLYVVKADGMTVIGNQPIDLGQSPAAISFF